jgi:predicted anti-sigma-YlaC factor YlaD
MCPDREILSAYLDGEIGSPWDRAIAEHVASCDSCREIYGRLEKTRSILLGETSLEWREPMERVRRGLAANVPPLRHPAPVWRRAVPIPLPVAVLAAALLLTLGVSLALSVMRTNIGFVRITRAPAGGTEYQFAVPVDKVEALLKSVGGGDASRDDVMKLPKNVKLIPVGQPRMGKAAEFPGIKQ